MPYNVLIADDSASTRSIIAKALRLSGVPIGDVHMAADGFEAVEILSANWIDVVLADLNMPRMDGVALIERMRHEGVTARVPVIVVSTEGRHDIIDGLLSLGAAAFLRKPFAPEQLGALIESVLQPEHDAPDQELVSTAFFDALEGFAMLVGEVLPEPRDLAGESHVAHVEFIGPGAQGGLYVAAAPEACRFIGCSATGEDECDGADALGELANVMAGQLVDRLPGGPFGLRPPTRSVADAEEAWGRMSALPAAVAFDVEGNDVVVGVDLQKRW